MFQYTFVFDTIQISNDKIPFEICVCVKCVRFGFCVAFNQKKEEKNTRESEWKEHKMKWMIWLELDENWKRKEQASDWKEEEEC